MKYLPCLPDKIFRLVYPAMAFLVIISSDIYAQASYLKIAQSLERQHEYQQAVDMYLKLYNTKKNDINILRGIKNCYQGLQQYDQLITFLKKAQKITPGNLYVPSYLGEAYYQINQRSEAMRIWNSHLERHAKDIAVYRIVASSMIVMRMFDAAIAVYEMAMNNLKSQYNLHLEIANLNKLQLKYAAATDHLLQFYKFRPKQFAYIQKQILNMADEPEQLPEIIQTIDNFVTQNPKTLQIQEIQANLMIKIDNFESALEIYERLENDKTKGRYLARFANEAKKNHAYEYGLQAYRIILMRYPESQFGKDAPANIAHAYKLLAYQNRDAGKFDLSGREIQKAVHLYDSITVNSANAIQKSEGHRQLGEIYDGFYYDLDKAIFHYKKYINLQPRGIQRDTGLIKLGDVYLRKNMLTQAGKTYAIVTTRQYKSIASFKNAEVLYYLGRFSEALDDLSGLQKTVSVKDGIYNDILERKQVIESFAGDSVNFYKFAQAELLIFQQKKSEAAEVLTDLARADKKISTNAGRIAGKLYLALDQPDRARELLQFLHDKYVDDIHMDEILFYLARSEENLGEYRRALDLYTQIITDHSTSLYLSDARRQARAMQEQLSKDDI